MSQLPRVTCLCLTMQGRKKFLKRAVDCYLKQTYPNRELLILPDSSTEVDGFVSFSHLCKDLRISVGDEGISVLVHAQHRNVGEKRNLGCESAKSSDLIVIWDDDDYSAPGRLAQQVRELEITRKAVTGYRGMKFTDGENWWEFQIARGFVIGSSLMFRRSWWQQHPFPDLQVGEDAQFADAASQAGQLAEVPDLNLMYATIHQGNTSRRDLTHPQYRPLPGFTWTE